MNSWPNIYIPPLPNSISLPELKLNTPYGAKNFPGQKPIRMYVCGITPYDATHLGHAATYLTFDVIHRYFVAQSRSVSFVENVTDIDDPLLERAKRDSVLWQDLAADQIELYLSDMTGLRIIPPIAFVPATQVMDLVSDAISVMKSKGYVYNLDDDLYFEISDFLDSLPISLDQAVDIFGERGGDPDRPGKHHRLDPILWMANRPGEPGWDSVHGFGRPGWHIECCVIALRYLLGPNYLEDEAATSIDIQGGGSDLIFPHHFMSAAQSSAITGKTFSYSFVNTGMVGLDGEKMSKSKGNLVFVSQLIAQGIDPMVVRFALLSNHYAADRMWSNDLLNIAQRDVNIIRSALSREEVAETDLVIQNIVGALANDLDTPQALSEIVAWAGATLDGRTGGSAGGMSRAIDSLLGLAL